MCHISSLPRRMAWAPTCTVAADSLPGRKHRSRRRDYWPHPRRSGPHFRSRTGRFPRRTPPRTCAGSPHIGGGSTVAAGLSPCSTPARHPPRLRRQKPWRWTPGASASGTRSTRRAGGTAAHCNTAGTSQGQPQPHVRCFRNRAGCSARKTVAGGKTPNLLVARYRCCGVARAQTVSSQLSSSAAEPQQRQCAFAATSQQ
mmetsp:Transcript_20472/g.45150  ORF Transcript_20472/g.45150 Transcript_20472/m.45150 type:complete len:200 (+) Transcript_20472:531-1130(+)